MLINKTASTKMQDSPNPEFKRADNLFFESQGRASDTGWPQIRKAETDTLHCMRTLQGKRGQTLHTKLKELL